MVHCSDGWDRTSLIVSLTELLLDPYYRTLHGFGILIQKEWLQFGHKFADRIGHGEPEDNTYLSEQSPIFFQFIDCVYQLLSQYPNWFEFNEHYLITILDELYSGRFGTFLMNSEFERVNISSQTLSLWPWILDNVAIFKNKEYCHYDQPILPTCSTSGLNVWLGYFERFKSSMSQQHQYYACTLQKNEDFSDNEKHQSAKEIRVAPDDKLFQELFRVYSENQLLKKRCDNYEKMLSQGSLLSDSYVGRSVDKQFHDPPLVRKYVENSGLDNMIREDYIPLNSH